MRKRQCSWKLRMLSPSAGLSACLCGVSAGLWVPSGHDVATSSSMGPPGGLRSCCSHTDWGKLTGTPPIQDLSGEMSSPNSPVKWTPILHMWTS